MVRTVTAAGLTRTMWTYLPRNYDPRRAYPTIYLFHGCGDVGRENNNVQMQTASREDAILVRGIAVDRCWNYTPNGPDIAFFDEMVRAVEADYCMDRSRRFAVGYSSGAWLIALLNCSRANVLRGAGTVAGGQPAGATNCTGPFPQIFVHDEGDPSNAIAGSMRVRDRLLRQNMCDAAATPQPNGPAPCVRYPGCSARHPVDWCATTGQGHSRQDAFAAPAFWRFFTAL